MRRAFWGAARSANPTSALAMAMAQKSLRHLSSYPVITQIFVAGSVAFGQTRLALSSIIRSLLRWKTNWIITLQIYISRWKYRNPFFSCFDLPILFFKGWKSLSSISFVLVSTLFESRSRKNRLISPMSYWHEYSGQILHNNLGSQWSALFSFTLYYGFDIWKSSTYSNITRNRPHA